ncbi:DUF6510 family protein [Streptomyces sp. NPDC004279]
MSAVPRRSSRRLLPTWCSWDMHLSEYVPSVSATVEVEMAPVEASGPNTDDTYTGYVDGNALAGPLSEVFAVDVTAAMSRCANCGCTGPLARLHLYKHAPGLVARCQQCGSIMLRTTRTRDAVWLDMSGVASLAIPLGET